MRFAKWISFIFFVFFSTSLFAFHHGIYVTQSSLLNSKKIHYFITQAKKHNIDTFIIDINTLPSKTYAANVADVIHNGITYVARIVVFPHGGTHAKIIDKSIWEKRLALAKAAAQLGAKAIQLDYIRYESKHPASPEKAKNILQVVRYFKKELSSDNVLLQMDIFGIAAHKPAHTIGQDPAILATTVDAFCPMVYPSHYMPFEFHSARPYETVFNSITALKEQIKDSPHVAIYAFIELYNYRIFMSHEKKVKYIQAEIDAAKKSGADGWYAWSPNNHYDVLFGML